MQFDHNIRVVSERNLEAMCKHISGVCHRFTVTSISNQCAKVVYSNPDEYANERHPITATFPVYVVNKIRHVVLSDFKNVTAAPDWNGEEWQAFLPLQDCPRLWRSNPASDDWKTREEIKAA